MKDALAVRVLLYSAALFVLLVRTVCTCLCFNVIIQYIIKLYMLWYLSGGWLWWGTYWLHMNRDPGLKPTGFWFVFGGYAAYFLFFPRTPNIFFTPPPLASFFSSSLFHQPLDIIRIQLSIGVLYQSHYAGYLCCRFHLTLWNASDRPATPIVLTFILLLKEHMHCSESLRECFIRSAWLKINLMGSFFLFRCWCFVFYIWNKTSDCNWSVFS